MQCHPADVGESNGQAGLPYGAVLACAHRGITLGVYGLARATPPRVALGVHLGNIRTSMISSSENTNLALVVLGRLALATAPLDMAALPSVGIFV